MLDPCEAIKAAAEVVGRVGVVAKLALGGVYAGAVEICGAVKSIEGVLAARASACLAISAGKAGAECATAADSTSAVAAVLFHGIFGVDLQPTKPAIKPTINKGATVEATIVLRMAFVSHMCSWALC